MANYKPELGQLVFKRNYQQFLASNLLISALQSISYQLELWYHDKYNEDIENPFTNSGGTFKNETFEVQAYNWDYNVEQLYNFKYKDIKVNWYKYLGRSVSVNKDVSPIEINNLLEDCLKSLEIKNEE